MFSFPRLLEQREASLAGIDIMQRSSRTPMTRHGEISDNDWNLYLGLGESHGIFRKVLNQLRDSGVVFGAQEIEWKHPSSQQVTLNSLMSHKVFDKKAGKRPGLGTGLV